MRPHFFLPVIEEHALSAALDEWVINEGLRQLDCWRQNGKKYHLSLNVSAYQLQQPDFLDNLGALLHRYPAVDPHQLELEVLETSTLQDLKQISQVIHQCHGLGVDFALDDFGTGYSSLNYLKQLPVNHLKIDRVFVRDMLDDPDDLTIVEAVLGLARAFRRQVTAEGMETIEHGTLLMQLGCEVAQGYAIARPMPAEELPAWLAQWQPALQWQNAKPLQSQDLPLLFAMVEKRAWAQGVARFLRDQRLTAPNLDHLQCRFGYWLENEGRQRFGDEVFYSEVELQHLRIHALAAELLALKDQGREEEALAQLPELFQLRDAIIDWIQQIMSASSAKD
jgi:EAL domain-containing protein (putative c-di-GMP-specific phosphodiesterase class I)